MKFSFSTAWGLTRPYWFSEERWAARGILAGVIALDMTRVYLATRFNFWQKDFYDTLVNRDINLVWTLLATLVILVSIAVVTNTSRTYLAQSLEMRWRSWITKVFVNRWKKDNAYYRIEQRRNNANSDNPDQRIADDLRIMASSTLNLSLGLLKNFVNLVSFSIIVWGLSGTLDFEFNGYTISLFGYMLWVAMIYAFVGSFVIEKIGNPIVGIDYEQQQCEADFRYLMVRLRENAEQIAFYRGGGIEAARLAASFATVKQNWGKVVDYTKRITLTETVYIEIGALVPYAISVPRYFAGLLTVGMVMQLGQSFMHIRSALSWFVFSYKDLALLRSAHQRLSEFDDLLRSKENNGIAITQSADAYLRVKNVQLYSPNGEALCIIEDLRIEPRQRLLLRGPSGVGKSTLLRALAGLWPYGSGHIELPQGRTMFLPQNNYLPIGSLRACISYPRDALEFTTDACIDALHAVSLASFVDELEYVCDWSKRMSPGEQQRLAFARVLLQRPTHLFLDEATSSLDSENESRLYQLVIDRLPGLTMVSVAHRVSLIPFHTQVLDMFDGNIKCVEQILPVKKVGNYR